jgi:RNA polymerase sigma factor (TIGR02999 family)
MAVVEPSLLGCGVGRCEPNQLRSASARVNVIAAAEDSMSDITELIGKARAGDAQASEHLFASLYGELRRLAAAQLRGDNIMRSTSLVHETWLKLANHGSLEVTDRSHYFAVAGRVMRQIVIDHVRARGALRRGGDVQVASLDTTALQVAGQGRDEDVLALDEALHRLGEVDPELASLVEMRFYAGLELSEISVVIDRSERSLKRDWRRARAFLQREMTLA